LRNAIAVGLPRYRLDLRDTQNTWNGIRVLQTEFAKDQLLILAANQTWITSARNVKIVDLDPNGLRSQPDTHERSIDSPQQPADCEGEKEYVEMGKAGDPGCIQCRRRIMRCSRDVLPGIVADPALSDLLRPAESDEANPSPP